MGRGNRTRTYLNRWMAVAEATGDAEKIIEQIMMERLLDAVSPKLRAWLKEQEPKTADDLGNLANLHVQSRKGALVGGKYVTNRGGGKSGKKERFGGKADDSLPEEKKIKIKKSLESPHPPPNKRLQSLKLSATNVVNRDTCRLTVVRVVGSPHRGTCCA